MSGLERVAIIFLLISTVAGATALAAHGSSPSSVAVEIAPRQSNDVNIHIDERAYNVLSEPTPTPEPTSVPNGPGNGGGGIGGGI